ncbi:DnaJ domain-containing protein [Pavlovales sp. CCMP2436]|nr:DnaJ domain-containing protein [Pavlovales sp. CCMP2436]
MSDYYRTLDIQKTADATEIKKAYRKMAMKWHPDKNTDKKEEAEARFKKIAEAYDVLSDPNKRETYDRYGESGLKRGGAGGMPGGGYQFNGNAEDLFKDLFGGAGGGGFADLFAQAAMNGGMGGGGGGPFMFSTGAGGPQFQRGGQRGQQQQQQQQQRRQQQGQQQLVECTLEELYAGTTKVLSSNGAPYSVEVKPGYKAGTKISFNERSTFVIAEKRHPLFKRTGNDLTFWCEVGLPQILTGSRQRVKTLDNRVLSVEFGPLAFWSVVPREGMPLSRSPGEKGSLTVYASPISAQQWEALKTWGTIAKYITGLYIFVNYSSLIMPLLMVYQLFRATAGG